MTYKQVSKSYFYPDIEFNTNDGILTIKGNSIIIDKINYYSRLEKWLNENLHKVEDLIVLNLHFNMFCPASSNVIIKILNQIKSEVPSEKLIINWFYNEDSILEIGKCIKEVTGIDINLIENENL